MSVTGVPLAYFFYEVSVAHYLFFSSDWKDKMIREQAPAYSGALLPTRVYKRTGFKLSIFFQCKDHQFHLSLLVELPNQIFAVTFSYTA